MKNLFILFIIISTISACTKFKNIKINTSNAPVIDYKLKGEKYDSWNAIKNNFERKVYFKCLKKYKLRLKCSHCDYIYIRVIITIDEKGKLTAYEKTDGNICGKKSNQTLEECFIEYFKNITFPINLRGMKIKTMLGTGLKC